MKQYFGGFFVVGYFAFQGCFFFNAHESTDKADVEI